MKIQIFDVFKGWNGKGQQLLKNFGAKIQIS